MAGSTDQRIVQLRFDNRQFERNIAKSKKSMEELKQAMNFNETSKGMEKFSQGLGGLSFSKLENNIQKLTDKFTGLGTASELVLSQIRRKIEETAAKVSGFIDSMTTQQISAGMTKYEMLNNSVQTIMSATGKDEATVNAVLDRLNKYTDQTSYNFADMAQNIGKFTSVGIPLEQAERQMEGVANWAARSGAGINEASRAMYNLSQAMGVGKLTKIDWKSIENAGMATKEFKEQLIQAGLAAGTLEKKGDKIFTSKALGKQVEVTYKNAAETLQKGWANSKVLGNTLERYYYDDLYYKNSVEPILKLEATQKETFDKMIENDQSLSAEEWKKLGQMGVLTEDVKQKILDLAVSQGKLTKETVKDGKQMYKAVNKSGKEILFSIDSIQEGLKAGWFDKTLADNLTGINELARSSYEAAQKCKTFTDVLGAWKDQISTGWMNSFKIIFGGLSESMEFFSNVCDRVSESIGNLIDFRNLLLQAWSAVGGRKSLIESILGDYGKETATGAFGFIDMLQGLGDIIREGFIDFASLFANPVDVIGFKKNPEYLGIWLGTKLAKITKTVQRFMQGIRDFFTEEVEVGGKTTSRLEMIRNVVTGIAGILAFGYNILAGVKEFVTEIGTQLQPSFDAILYFLSKLGLSIYDTAGEANASGSIINFFRELAETLSPLTGAINDVIGTVTELLGLILNMDKQSNTSGTILTKVANGIKKAAQIISNVATPIITFFKDIVSAIKGLFESDFSAEALEQFGPKIGEAFNKMVDNMPAPIKDFINFFRTIFGDIKEVFNSGFSGDSFEKLKNDFIGPFVKAFDSIPQTLKDKVSEILQKIIGIFGRFWAKITGQAVPKAGKDDPIGQAIDQKFDSMTQIGEKIKKNMNWNGSKGFFANIWDWVKNLFSPKTADGAPEESQSIFAIAQTWISDKLTGFQEFLQRAVGNTNEAGNTFGAKFAEIMSKIIEFFKGLDWNKLLLYIGGGVGLLMIIKTVAKTIKMIKKLGQGLADLGDALKNGFSLKLKDDDKKVETFATKMVKIAAAIAVLTACIVTIGNMAPDEAFRGIMYVITLMAALALMSYAMKKVFSGMKIAEAAAAFVTLYGIALSVGRLVKAIIPLGQLNTDQLQSMLWGLVGVIGTFAVLGAMSQNGMFKFDKNAGILALAGAIAILIHSLQTLKDLRTEQLIQMALSLIVLLSILIIAMGVIKKFSLSMDKTAMTQMIAFAGAIAILIFALLPLSIMSWDKLIRMGASLLALITILTLSMLLISKLKISAEGTGMTQMIAFAAAIAILIFALLPLAIMPLGGLIQMGASLIALITILTISMKRISKSKISAEGTGMVQMIAFAGAIAILIFALLPLVFVRWDGLARMLLGLVVTIGALVAAMVIIKKNEATMKGTGIAAFIAVAFSLAIMVLALLPLAALDPQQLYGFIIGLLAVTASIAILVDAISKLDLKSAVGGLLVMLSLAVVIGVFGVTIASLGDMNWGTIAAFAGGLAVMLYGMAKAIEVLSHIPSPGGAFKAILILAAGLVVIGAALALVIPMLMGAVGSSMSEFAARLAVMGEMLASFSSSMSSLDSSGMDKGSEIITKMGELLQQMVTFKLNAGVVQDFQNSISRLTLTARSIRTFDSTMTSISDDAGVGKMRGIIGDVKKLFDEDLNGFGSQVGTAFLFDAALFSLGSGLVTFSSYSDKVGDPKDNKALEMLSELSACAPNLDTILKMDIPGLSDKLSALGGAMMIYAQGASEVGNPGEVDTATVNKAVEILQAITTRLAEEGGITIPDNLPEETKIAGFGGQLAALAAGLVKFEEAGKGLGDGSQEALSVLDYFYELKQKLKPSFASDLKSTITAFVGSGDSTVQPDELTRFGTNITDLANALSHFAQQTSIVDDATGEVKPIDFSLATNALTSIAKLHETLPKKNIEDASGAVRETSSALSELSGDISSLSESLALLAEKTGIFSSEESARTYTPIDYSHVTTFLDSVVALQDTLNKKNYFSTGWDLVGALLGQDLTIDDIGNQLQQLGASLKIMSNSITGETDGKKNFDSEAANSAMDLLNNSVLPFMQSLATTLPAIGGLSGVWNTFANGRAMNLEDMGKQIGALGDGLGKMGAGLQQGNWGSENLGAENAFKALDAMIGIMLKLEKLDDMTDSADASLSKLALFSQSLTDQVEYTVHGLAGDQLGFTNIIDNIVKFIYALDDAFADLGGDKDVTDVMLKRLEAFKTFAEGLDVLTNNVDISISWDFIGKKLTGDVAQAIITGTSDVTTAAAAMITGARNAASSAADWAMLGTNIATGVSAGINRAAAQVGAAAARMAMNAYNQARRAVQSRSPSRLFMELGGYMSEGTAIGIDRGEGQVEKSAAEMSEAALDSASNVIGLISRIMAEGASASPAITPVLDLSQVEAGMDNLTGRSFGLNASVSAGIASSVGSGADPAQVEANTLAMTDALNKMRMDMSAAMEQMTNTMTTKLRNMQIVLDSGVLAGGVTDGVDSNIGRKAFYAGRRN